MSQPLHKTSNKDKAKPIIYAMKSISPSTQFHLHQINTSLNYIYGVLTAKLWIWWQDKLSELVTSPSLSIYVRCGYKWIGELYFHLAPITQNQLTVSCSCNVAASALQMLANPKLLKLIIIVILLYRSYRRFNPSRPFLSEKDYKYPSSSSLH